MPVGARRLVCQWVKSHNVSLKVETFTHYHSFLNMLHMIYNWRVRRQALRVAYAAGQWNVTGHVTRPL